MFKRRVDGRLISRTLGDAMRMPLAEAREMAVRIRQDIHFIGHGGSGETRATLPVPVADPSCPTFADFVAGQLLAMGAWQVEARFDQGIASLSAHAADPGLRQVTA